MDLARQHQNHTPLSEAKHRFCAPLESHISRPAGGTSITVFIDLISNNGVGLMLLARSILFGDVFLGHLL
jgi:hypothetical protein